MANVPFGTKQSRFYPPTGTDTMLQGSGSTRISVKFQCITVMTDYENKSMEELRLEDYGWLKEKASAKVDNFEDATSLEKKRRESERRAARAIRNLQASKDAFRKRVEVAKARQKKSLYIEASTQTEEDICVSKLLQGLKEMLLKSKHSDFILNVTGKEFRVHKIILEAQSPVFAAMLEHDTKEKANGVANINDFEPLTITNFLNFLYTGRVENLNTNNVLDLYTVADKYQVTELSNLCIKYMKNNISIENFCSILNLSLRHHVQELTEVATQFFIQNSTEIALTPEWQIFLAENPVASNELFLKALNLKKE